MAGLPGSSDGPPGAVLAAVALLGCIFCGGGIYLFISGPFTGVEVVAPAELPEVTAATMNYRGTLFGLETSRRLVAEELAKRGLAGGPAITIYPFSPLHMRPIDVSCRLGYLLLIGRAVTDLPEPVQLEILHPGRRLLVRVRGHGNFTGNKAYKAAIRFLRPLHLQPAEQERYEVKLRSQREEFVEHWIPVE